MIYTGWANYWGLYDSWEQYWSIARGWPGLSPDAARYLVSKGIIGIGIDTLSIDPPPQAVDFPAHKVIVNANIWIGENFNLAILPKRDTAAFIFTLPAMIVKEGSGAPSRPILIYNFNLEIIISTYMSLKRVLTSSRYSIAYEKPLATTSSVNLGAVAIPLLIAAASIIAITSLRRRTYY